MDDFIIDTSMMTSYALPSDDELKSLELDELEEEYARMARWRDHLLEQGRTAEAAELTSALEAIEDCISDMENEE